MSLYGVVPVLKRLNIACGTTLVMTTAAPSMTKTIFGREMLGRHVDHSRATKRSTYAMVTAGLLLQLAQETMKAKSGVVACRLVQIVASEAEDTCDTGA